MSKVTYNPEKITIQQLIDLTALAKSKLKAGNTYTLCFSYYIALTEYFLIDEAYLKQFKDGVIDIPFTTYIVDQLHKHIMVYVNPYRPKGMPDNVAWWTTDRAGKQKRMEVFQAIDRDLKKLLANETKTSL